MYINLTLYEHVCKHLCEHLCEIPSRNSFANTLLKATFRTPSGGLARVPRDTTLQKGVHKGVRASIREGVHKGVHEYIDNI